MNSYIVDTSALLKRFINEENSVHAIAMIQELRQRKIELTAPEFALIECVNVLWHHVQRQGMPPTYAALAVNILVSLPITLVPLKALYPRALQIAIKHNLAIYDSLYIALAERISCPLITADVKQSTAAAAEGIVLKPITDFAAP